MTACSSSLGIASGAGASGLRGWRSRRLGAVGLLASIALSACGETTEPGRPGAGDSTASVGGSEPAFTGASGGSGSMAGGGAEAGGPPSAGFGGSGGAPVGGFGGTPPISTCRTRADCPRDEPEICGSGADAACVDESADPKNCGKCGLECAAGAACADGQCGARPADIVSSPDCGAGVRLALAGTRLYWTESVTGKVRSVEVTGSTVTDVATEQLQPTQIVTDGDAVYWANQGDGKTAGSSAIMKRLLAANSPAPEAIKIAVGFDKLPALAIGSDNLYYALRNDVHQISRTGTGDIVVGTSVDYDHPDNPMVVGEPLGLAVNATRVVFSTPGTRQSVESHTLTEITMIKGDTGHALLGKGLGALLVSGDVAADDHYTYWADGEKIDRNAVDAAEPTYQIITSAPGSSAITAFVVANDSVYAATEDGRIFKHSLTPPADPNNDTALPLVIARDQMRVTSLVADAEKLYWVTTDCVIRSLPL